MAAIQVPKTASIDFFIWIVVYFSYLSVSLMNTKSNIALWKYLLKHVRFVDQFVIRSFVSINLTPAALFQWAAALWLSSAACCLSSAQATTLSPCLTITPPDCLSLWWSFWRMCQWPGSTALKGKCEMESTQGWSLREKGTVCKILSAIGNFGCYISWLP